MNSKTIVKENILALFLLLFIVAFLSSPYLVKADASVDGFFPQDFVRKGYFNEEIAKSFITKSNMNNTKPAEHYKPAIVDNCNAVNKSIKDSFAIPIELVNCSKNIKPRN